MAMILQVERLSFHYQHASPLLKALTFGLEEGKILTLLGPNGAGKTSLLRCLLGLNRPQSGSIRVAGQEITALSARQRAGLLAYVPQTTALTFPYPVRDVVMMGRLSHLAFSRGPGRADRQAVEQALCAMGIETLADAPFQQLSGGERQLVTIARALAQQARLLLLDEPTASLDFANQARTLERIRHLSAQGFSIVMTTHTPDHALWLSDSTVLLKNGALFAQGPTPKVIVGDTLSRLYGIPVAIAQTDLTLAGRPLTTCVPLLVPESY